jgi:hypothetical protein
MQQRYLGRIEPHMDVCDVNGDKVGTIERVYRHDLAAVGSTTTGPSSGVSTLPDEYIEVKTGFLGFGKHYYVPMSAIQDVTQGGVFLDKSREEIEHNGWSERPDHLDELS